MIISNSDFVALVTVPKVKLNPFRVKYYVESESKQHDSEQQHGNQAEKTGIFIKIKAGSYLRRNL